MRRAAIVLKFDPGFPGPYIVGKGWGKQADFIVELAKNADIPIYSDDSLANFLGSLPNESEIPTEYFVKIAQIYSLFYQWGESNGLFRK